MRRIGIDGSARRLGQTFTGMGASGTAWIAALVLLAALCVAGCGGGSPADGAATPVVEVTTVKTTKRPMPENQVQKTKHLPKGTRFTVTKGRRGERELTYTVEVRGGVRTTPSPPDEALVSLGVPPLVWSGTGRRSSASVSKLATGTKINQSAATVTNPSKVIDGRRGRLAVGARLSNPRAGNKLRFILLSPASTTTMSKTSIAKSGYYDWYDFSSTWTLPSGQRIEPRGKWIVVVEVDGRPAAWKVFTVK